MKFDRGAVMWGVVFVAIGTAYLLEEFGVWSVRLAYLWPALLIVAGLSLAATAIGDGERQ
jgi:Domain of unknown function (DUF5668)